MACRAPSSPPRSRRMREVTASRSASDVASRDRTGDLGSDGREGAAGSVEVSGEGRGHDRGTVGAGRLHGGARRCCRGWRRRSPGCACRRGGRRGRRVAPWQEVVGRHATAASAEPGPVGCWSSQAEVARVAGPGPGAVGEGDELDPTVVAEGADHGVAADHGVDGLDGGRDDHGRRSGSCWSRSPSWTDCHGQPGPQVAAVALEHAHPADDVVQRLVAGAEAARCRRSTRSTGG